MSIELKPGLPGERALEAAAELFGLHGTAESLPGERDQNFLVTSPGGERYVLKIVNRSEDIRFLEAEIKIIGLLNSCNCRVPTVIMTKDGRPFQEFESIDGEKYLVWMLTYVEGRPWGSLHHHSTELLYSAGFELGRIDRCLDGFENLTFERKFDWDLKGFAGVLDRYLGFVTDPDLLKFIRDTLALYHSRVVPVSQKLRKSVIHNDANDFNLIVNRVNDTPESYEVNGIIDFGDSVYSWTISNLAVMLAYIILDKPEPLVIAGKVLNGYNDSFGLLPVEAEVLYTLVRMRLSVSICMAAWQQGQRPGDKYLSISQEPIRRSVKRLERINPDMAATFFRIICGLSPAERFLSINEYITRTSSSAFPVLGIPLTTANCKVLDLSVEGEMISGDHNLNRETHLTSRIGNEMETHNADIGIGRYDEPRILYNSPLFSNTGFSEIEDRTIHLGIDLFSKAGQPLFSPYDGVFHSLSYNPAPLDYGNVIIIKHSTDQSLPFYTLYGHLGSESLSGKKVGDTVKAGERIAVTGIPGENGGWTPHLHFQIISDISDVNSDFPGVCTPGEREAWKIISPDPNILLGIPVSLFPPVPAHRHIILKKRNELLGSSLKLGYRDHIKMSRGWMQYMYDSNGQRFLDGYNNVPHVGHCHPEVVEAAASQMRKLNTNTRYLFDSLADYAELLLSTFPPPLDRCFFLNSGSEANELALRLAYAYTGRKDIVVIDGAYHGNTTSMIDISPYKHDGPGGNGAPDWVHKVEVADCYRGQYRYDDPEAGRKYASSVSSVISKLGSEGRRVAAFIAETCPSVGGQIIFPAGYLDNVYRHIREGGGICIADEVQTGYGRMGSSFYAFTDQGVVPDIVVLGKPIGNGHPLAAVVTTSEIAASFDNGMEFFSTFGGNSVSSVVGRKVLEITLRDNLMEHAMKAGSYLIDRLNGMKEKYPVIGDVRGSGLFIGIELVRSRETLEPASGEASMVVNRMRENRILIGTDGPFHNVLKIRPPMPFNQDDADILAERLEEIFVKEIFR